jgi:hypothetical protein
LVVFIVIAVSGTGGGFSSRDGRLHRAAWGSRHRD